MSSDKYMETFYYFILFVYFFFVLITFLLCLQGSAELDHNFPAHCLQDTMYMKDNRNFALSSENTSHQQPIKCPQHPDNLAVVTLLTRKKKNATKDPATPSSDGLRGIHFVFLLFCLTWIMFCLQAHTRADQQSEI